MERYLGLDVGEKTIGVAVSDPLGLTAQGVEVIRRSTYEQDLARLNKLVQHYQVGAVVVGLPKNMDGSLGSTAEAVQQFAHSLEKDLQLPIVFWDERLSTVAAERTLLAADVSRSKRRRVIDKLAAGLILQGYLDRQGLGKT